MGSLDELYREIILEHFKSPHHKGSLANANRTGEGMNPLCGDDVQISLLMNGDTIQDIRFDGHGCAISQAAASMMTDAVKGKSVEAVLRLARGFKAVFGVKDDSTNGQKAPPPLTEEEMGDRAALEGVKKFPVRIKCAILSWNTLLETLNK